MEYEILTKQLNDVLKILNNTLNNFESSLKTINLKLNDVTTIVTNNRIDNEQLRMDIDKLNYELNLLNNKVDNIQKNMFERNFY